ncbi:hypothetical protein THER5_2090 [Bifidobacterium thermacidophilum subsp. thermacidophilum]|uniref:Uncharacterized protein n=1 Tax=Bifidobacterium thermacidophilum subsp. thermacidophilum TaxID=79262 RepID=A0A087E684_9BIFI|nr:hypothetical protein THER5_2090 [Bifidobacterium thermacidophilum subsp. thermacidophilum]
MSGVSARGGVPEVRHAAEILYMARALIIKLPVLGSHIGIKKASAASAAPSGSLSGCALMWLRPGCYALGQARRCPATGW